MNSIKKIVIGICVLVLIGAGLYFVSILKSNKAVVVPVTAPYGDEIRVKNPAQNQKIFSPIKITGEAKGTWYFEGTFNAELFDSNNTSLGSAQVAAKGDWMSESFVPFEGILSFSSPTTKHGILVIKKDNPSGLSRNEKKLVIPVSF